MANSIFKSKYNHLLVKAGLLSLMLGFTSGADAFAASFDCTKASNWLEKRICNNQKLSELDDTLEATYKEALAKSKNPEQLKADQRVWLKNLVTEGYAKSKCEEPAKGAKHGLHPFCLSFFEQRIEFLKNEASQEKIGDCKDDIIKSISGRLQTPEDDTAVIQLQSGLVIFVSSASKVDSSFPATEKFDKKYPDSFSKEYRDAVTQYVLKSNDFEAGNTVKACLRNRISGCPPEDNRGKEYSIQSLKDSKNEVTGLDSWHTCGGA